MKKLDRQREPAQTLVKKNEKREEEGGREREREINIERKQKLKEEKKTQWIASGDLTREFYGTIVSWCTTFNNEHGYSTKANALN